MPTTKVQTTYVVRKTGCDWCSPVSRKASAVKSVFKVDPDTGLDVFVADLCQFCFTGWKLAAEDENATIVGDVK